jgi:hypothetical protein
MKYLVFLAVLLTACGVEAPVPVCEPPSVHGGCFVDDDDTVFRPCDPKLGYPRDGGCFARFLDGVALVAPGEIMSCRACLRRYYPTNQVEAYCSIYDYAE